MKPLVMTSKRGVGALFAQRKLDRLQPASTETAQRGESRRAVQEMPVSGAGEGQPQDQEGLATGRAQEPQIEAPAEAT